MLIHTIRPPLGCSAALRDGGYLKTTVSGPVQIGFGLEPSISIGDTAGEDDEMPAQDQRSFSFTGVQAGLTSAFAGTYTLSDSEDTIDAVATGNAPELTKLLDVYDIKSDFEGSGTVSARFTGTLNAPKTNIPVALGDPLFGGPAR